jgi:hypothetical protein
MDGRIKLSEFYVVDRNNTLDEDNEKKLMKQLMILKALVKMEQLQS